MPGKSDYAEGAMLQQWLGAASGFVVPANVYVGLYSAAPSDAGGGTELTGSGYARVAVPNNSANWVESSGKIQNANQIVYAAATANWLAAVAVGLFDALTGGNMLFFVPLTPSVTILQNAKMTIPVSALQFVEE